METIDLVNVMKDAVDEVLYIVVVQRWSQSVVFAVTKITL